MVGAVFFYYGPGGSGKSYAVRQRVNPDHTAYNPPHHICVRPYTRLVWPANDISTDIVFHMDYRLAGVCPQCVQVAVACGKRVHIETNQDPRRWAQFRFIQHIVAEINEFRLREQPPA